MALATFTLVLWTLILVLIVYKCLTWSFYKPAGFPPGPPRLPLVGSYLFLLVLNHREMHKAALKLSQFYRTKVKKSESIKYENKLKIRIHRNFDFFCVNRFWECTTPQCR